MSEVPKLDGPTRSRLRLAVAREIARGRSTTRAAEILHLMEKHHRGRMGDSSDPWILILYGVFRHLGKPIEHRLAAISNRKLSSVLRRVVDRVRCPGDEALSKLLIRSFIKIPGVPTPALPHPTLPPGGAASALSARDAYGRNP